MVTEFKEAKPVEPDPLVRRTKFLELVNQAIKKKQNTQDNFTKIL